MNIDELFMSRCFQLAKLGVGSVAPNPMVGALLVYDNIIIGEGYHKKYGEAHAEVNCIDNALQTNAGVISKSTLYVSLEPCSHHGKTPPCADLIIKHKIPKVVIGCRDSFEEVNGRGVERLKNAGIEVVENTLSIEALQLNKKFFTYHKHKRPYIILKWAQTFNGFIATENDERLIISNELSHRLVHKWRSEEAAILVGANTAIKDNPILDNRFWFGNGPLKIIIDPHLKVPKTARMFNTGNILSFNFNRNETKTSQQYAKINKGQEIKDIMDFLYNSQIQSVLVEGGRKTLQSFLDAGLWDEARVIVNRDLTIDGGIKAPILQGASKYREIIMDSDIVSFFENKTVPF